MAQTKIEQLQALVSVTANLKNIPAAYRTEFQNAKVDDTTCGSCIGFFKNFSIPANYVHVIDWLANIGTAEAAAELAGKPVDTVVITTALIVSTQYAAAQVANAIACAALNTVVADFAQRFNLNLKSEVNPAVLAIYCQINNIIIPAEILPLLVVKVAPATVPDPQSVPETTPSMK